MHTARNIYMQCLMLGMQREFSPLARPIHVVVVQNTTQIMLLAFVGMVFSQQHGGIVSKGIVTDCCTGANDPPLRHSINYDHHERTDYYAYYCLLSSQLAATAVLL